MRQTISINKLCRKRKVSAYAQAIRALADKKADNIVVIDISRFSSYADVLVICSATSAKHAQTLAEEVSRKSGKRASLEGYGSDEWILADLGGMVIHIFSRDARREYDLEGLWYESPVYVLSEEADFAEE